MQVNWVLSLWKVKTAASSPHDTVRETFWKDREQLIGHIVEVRADAVTQNQDVTDEYSLRFPRFLRFRGFEPGEKL